MHTINKAVRRTYKQIGLSQPVTNVSLQQQMISVYSPKGGVGKSTIVRELSHVLSAVFLVVIPDFAAAGVKGNLCVFDLTSAGIFDRKAQRHGMIAATACET